MLVLGTDDTGRALEIIVVDAGSNELLVIHAMDLRNKFRRWYEESTWLPSDDA